MRLLLQWTLLDPTDWLEIDLRPTGAFRRAWENLPDRGVPGQGVIGGLDNIPGWIYDVNVQGVSFAGHDHYSARPLQGGGLEVAIWDDDPNDFPPGTREAQVWTFLDPAPDPAFGGLVNTRQSRIVYTERTGVHAEDARTTVRPWSEFTPPSFARHGVWVTDEKAAEHKAAKSLRGWREWRT